MPVLIALVPVVSLVGLLVLVLIVLPARDPSFRGSAHLPLVLATGVAAVLARCVGHRWSTLERGIVEAVRMAMPAILVLLTIGMLMGTWLAAGVVPALIDWGLALMHPRYFLPTTCAVCSMVSIVSGSSWSTAGTVGLALMGIGEAMGVNPAMTAGAVISGAYFGDKISPMSDTTNLAPAVAGTDLFTHVKHMLYTTIPAWVLAMMGYLVLGFDVARSADTAGIAEIRELIRRTFDPGIMHVLPPVTVLALVLARRPALPSLFAGALLGAVLAWAQGVEASAVFAAAFDGYRAHTGHASVDELLSRGGLMSMANTVFLILCAMAFGGVMEVTGMLTTLARQLLSLARSTGSLVATTILTCVGVNVLAADQYIAIVVPGRMYARAYRERGLHAKNLSRALEDGGTLTSVLVPWNTCGAFMTATLAVSTGAYLPYAFLNLLNPVISIVYGFTGWTIHRTPAASRD